MEYNYGLFITCKPTHHKNTFSSHRAYVLVQSFPRFICQLSLDTKDRGEFKGIPYWGPRQAFNMLPCTIQLPEFPMNTSADQTLQTCLLSKHHPLLSASSCTSGRTLLCICRLPLLLFPSQLLGTWLLPPSHHRLQFSNKAAGLRSLDQCPQCPAHTLPQPSWLSSLLLLKIKNTKRGPSFVVKNLPLVKNLPCNAGMEEGAWVQSVFTELRSHKPQSNYAWMLQLCLNVATTEFTHHN